MPYATTPERLARYEYIIEVLKIRYHSLFHGFIESIYDFFRLKSCLV
jgi:hypothetical protein